MSQQAVRETPGTGSHEKLVLIAAGGTGGHLFPAMSVADAIRKAMSGVRIQFVGTGRDVERHIIEKAGYGLIELRVRPLKGKSIIYKCGALAALLPAIVHSIRLIRRLRPALVIGGGGYVSGPFVLAAALTTPTLIMEVNLRPGLTTRWLAPFVECVACSFKESVGLFGKKGIYVGHPVRPDFFGVAHEEHDPLAVLVFGGSQGSSVLNQAIVDALPKLVGRITMIHQTGSRDFEGVRSAHEASRSGAAVSIFIDGMANAFSCADIIVCRAGASTIAEIAAAGKPSILVPFGAAADNHQEINARAMERAGAAAVVTESELVSGKLVDCILELAASPEKRLAMSRAAHDMANPRSSSDVAAIAVELMGREDRTEVGRV